MDVLYEELLLEEKYDKVLVLMKREDGLYVINEKSERNRKIDSKSDDIEIVDEIFNKSDGFYKNRKYSWADESNNNYSIPLNINLNREIILYIESKNEFEDSSYEIKLLKNYISQMILALENVYYFLKKEKNMRKIMLLEKFSANLYSKNNVEKIKDYLLYALKFIMGDIVEKACYFEYYEDSNSFLLSNCAKKSFEYESDDFDDNFIYKIEEVLREEKEKKVYLRLKAEELNSWTKNIEIIKNKEIKKNFKGNEQIISFIGNEKMKFGLMVLDLNQKGKLDEISDIIESFRENMQIFFTSLLEDNEIYEKEKEKSFRCKKCNAKLSEYKGGIDFLEIKCPKCNTMNTIEMRKGKRTKQTK